MSEELFAVSTIPPAPAAQSDYDSICAALMQTERGRWFLEEYARRNRSADTRILLAAIQRIETVVCADRGERERQAQQGFRTDLLEMAQAIIRTRAEVDEIPSDSALRPQAAGLDGEAEPPPRTRDVFAAAERIRDVTWAMRGHGYDPSTCDQLEELAASILSASALRDPTDCRASKLSEVLQYLEHRIETLLVGSRDGEAAAAAPRPRSHAALPAPAAAAEPVIGLPGPTTPPELAAADLAADVETPPPDFHPALSAAHDDLEGDTEVPPRRAVEIGPQEPPPARELEAAAEPAEPIPAVPADVLTAEAIDLPATDAGPEPLAAEAVERQAEESVSPRIQEVEAQAAELTSASEPSVAGGTEPAFWSADREPAVASSPPPGTQAAPSAQAAPDDLPQAEPPCTTPEAATGSEAPSAPAMDPDALTAGEEARLPVVDLTYAIPWLPGFSGFQPAAAAPAPARSTIVLDLDEADWAALGPPEPDRPPPSPAAPQPAAAEDMSAWQIEMPKPTEAGELRGVPAPVAPAPASQAAAMPQLPHCDPLAALKVMSPEELIALFS